MLGKKFALTTIISTFVYPTFLSVVRQIPGVADMTDNIMLATIYGGALLGAWNRFDCPGRSVHRRNGYSGAGIQQMVSYSSGSAFVCCRFYSAWNAGILSNSEQILYGILALILTTIVLNRVMLMGTVSDSVIYYHGAL